MIATLIVLACVAAPVLVVATVLFLRNNPKKAQVVNNVVDAAGKAVSDVKKDLSAPK